MTEENPGQFFIIKVRPNKGLNSDYLWALQVLIGAI